MPTLYDNFNRVKDFINENNSSYVSKAELASASYASITYLYNNGLKFYPDSIEIDKNIDFEQDAYFHVGTTYISDLYIGEESINTVFPTYTYVENNFVSSRTDIPVTYIGYSFLKNHNSSDGSELFINGILANGIDIVNDISNPSNTLISLNDEGLYVNSGQLYCNDYTCLGTCIDLEGTTYTHDIIPSSNNSYTLGDANTFYSATYTNKIVLDTYNMGLSSNNQYVLDVNLNTQKRYSFGGSGFFPQGNNKTLGTSSAIWAATYTSNLYANTAYFQNTSYTSSIVPKETATYTLGDSSHFYNVAYTTGLFLHPSNGWVNVSNWQTKFRIDNSDKFYLTSNRFYPNISGGAHLGSSSNRWGDTYSTNIYTPNIFDPANSNNSIKFQNGSIRFAYNDVGFYLDNTGFRPGTNGNKLLGTSSNKWGVTYTSNIYVDSSAYLPKNTYWYDGSSYRWLGDLFN